MVGGKNFSIQSLVIAPRILPAKNSSTSLTTNKSRPQKAGGARLDKNAKLPQLLQESGIVIIIEFPT